VKKRAFAAPALAFAIWMAWAIMLSGCAGKSAEKSAQVKGNKKADAAPVSVSKVTARSVPVEVQVIGNVEPYATIAVKSQVAGEIVQVHFTEGDYVKKGDLLFEIDRRPLEAQLAQAEANLARDTAQQRQAEANLARDIAQEKYARSQSGRYQNLFQQGVISREQTEQFRSDADAKEETVQADRAAIESAKAAILADRAAVDNLKVQIGYTSIRSRIDGRTGNVMVKQGNIVQSNTVDLVTIHQLQPIYVTFAVPEVRLPEIERYMAQRKLTVRAAPENAPDEQETGELTFVDNAVDPSTGTIRLKGTFSNQNRKLWPGRFVRVTLGLTMQQAALVVPAPAIQTGQDGSYVYVVKPDQTVEARPVVAGIRVGQEQVVEKGISEGETVVTEGQLRLVPGSRVSVETGRVVGTKKKT
jgi:membrane fusion protein, multidrug efflux system